ncbi:MAG: aldo/keto reductase [Gemmatimonadota bacterium]|nr:MAG: aldo/keto reductase [Gemmatimonadota bacterium]
MKSRRSFLKKGITGVAGLSLFPAACQKDRGAQEQGAREKKVVTRTLGKTGLTLPLVNMGVMNADNPNLVKVALDRGIVMLDTAHYYMYGRNEEMIGGVIKDYPRDAYVIATKARATTVDRHTRLETEDVQAETFESFIKKFELSLLRLGLTYVDILYLHSVKSKEDAMIEHIVGAMEKLKQDGKVRHVGLSTHGNEPEVIRAAADSGFYEVVLTSYNFLQAHREEVESAIAYAAGAGLGIVAMKTQAGVYWDRERSQRINMKAALKWVLQNENVHTTIPGFTTYDQLEEDLAVMEDPTLTPKDKEDLQLGMDLKFDGLYCQQCGACLEQCDRKVEIPTLMRSYMYLYGYRNLAAAKQTLQSLDMPAIPCERCNPCLVNCSRGFDIKNRMVDIARLKYVPQDFLV